MKKNSALAGFVQRFQAILDALDELDMDETLEELNAEFEDTLFMLESIDEEGEDFAEEIGDSMDDFNGLLTDYRALAAERPEIGQSIIELEMAIRMAENNLK